MTVSKVVLREVLFHVVLRLIKVWQLCLVDLGVSVVAQVLTQMLGRNGSMMRACSVQRTVVRHVSAAPKRWVPTVVLWGIAFLHSGEAACIMWLSTLRTAPAKRWRIEGRAICFQLLLLQIGKLPKQLLGTHNKGVLFGRVVAYDFNVNRRYHELL